MKFCNKCGKKIRENNKFCRYCGTSVTSTSYNDYEKNNSNLRGTESGSATNSNKTLEKRENGNNRNKIYIGGSVALIVLVIILVVLFNNNNNSDNEYYDDYYSEADYYGDTDYSDNYESYYDVVKKDITWEEAYEEASSNGGKLACIHSYDEFEEICSLADYYDLKVIWVGAYREKYEDWEDVYWIDGTEMSFTQWYDGEPSYNYDGIEERYLMMFKVGDIWYFNDAENDVSNPEYYYQGKIGYAVVYE